MTRIGETSDLLKCSFCGKTQKQVKKLIAGPGVYICDECIDLCNEIIVEELSETAALGLTELPKPQEIFDFPYFDGAFGHANHWCARYEDAAQTGSHF